MLTQKQIAEIVKLRGLGYNQDEIATILGIKRGVVQYQLERINQRARDEGDDDVFCALLVGAGLGIAAGLILSKLLEENKRR